MEAASRPPLELLDLPVEEPVDPAQRAASSGAPPVLPPAAPAGTESKDPAQTSIQFLDPASLVLATAEVPALTLPPKAAPAPVAASPAASPAAPKSETPPAAAAVQAPELELLEDPAVVEELLTTPPPPPPVSRPLPAEPAPTLTPSAPKAATGAAPPKESAPRVEARVPIAKTASLSSAAHKVAAASRRSEKTSPPLAPAPPRPAASPAAVPASAAAPVPAAKPKPAAPASAENLASWTSARAAAAPAKAKAPSAPAPAPATPKPQAKAPAPTPPAAPASTAGASPTAALDRDSIARNQIVERYLSGRLPLKGATEFEQYCGRHPEVLDEIGLPERVNAGLRLLEAAGKPEPWQEAPRPAWQKPQVTLALAAAVGVLGMALAVVSGTAASKNHRITQLQKQVNERPLDPATSTREIRLVPNRSGASNAPAITIGGGSTQLADFKIDESRSPYHIYRITIDRIDQGRVGVISNLVKDSNGHLRLALNSSALGPGNYQLTIEGINWRGDPEPDSWVTIGIAR